MNTVHAVRRILVRVVLSSVVAAAAVGSVAGTAGAHPGPVRTVCDPRCHGYWCPGDPLPTSNMPISWSMENCHEYHEAESGDIQEGPLPADAVRCTPFSYLCPEGSAGGSSDPGL